jgi:YVTN family beta-propeller protein
VTNYNSNNTSVIDTATNTVTAAVDREIGPHGVAFDPSGNRVYVTNSRGNNVSVIDTATNKVIKTINVGSNPAAFGQFIGPLPAQLTPLIAAFSASPTSGNVPFNVSFTDGEHRIANFMEMVLRGQHKHDRTEFGAYIQ